ncbi:hypothetical protein CRENBAI_020841 [Crenichthys baileyi]|uniref:Uncharacterized protein n=1 Tax=Crenichthys baileyi TaxID=28760 RepID=A0AAV9SA78_9TELE
MQSLQAIPVVAQTNVGLIVALFSCWHLLDSSPAPATGMMFRLGRLTPGYFRLLQRQMSGEVQVQPYSSIMEPVAMMMAALGLGVSVYSARQMAASCKKRH